MGEGLTKAGQGRGMSLARRIAVFLLVAAGVQSCILGIAYYCAPMRFLFPWWGGGTWGYYASAPEFPVLLGFLIVEGLVLHLGSLHGSDLVFGRTGVRGRRLARTTLLLLSGLALLLALHLAYYMLLVRCGVKIRPWWWRPIIWGTGVTHPWIPLVVGLSSGAFGSLLWRNPEAAERTGIFFLLAVGVQSLAISVLLLTGTDGFWWVLLFEKRTVTVIFLGLELAVLVGGTLFCSDLLFKKKRTGARIVGIAFTLLVWMATFVVLHLAYSEDLLNLVRHQGLHWVFRPSSKWAWLPPILGLLLTARGAIIWRRMRRRDAASGADDES